MDTLTRLSSIPLNALDLPTSFAPDPQQKPYFTRQVKSLLTVSKAQSEATSKQGEKTGEIWGTKELRPFFETGARLIAQEEQKRNVASVVHGDFKIDNLVYFLSLHLPFTVRADDRSFIPPNLELLGY